MPNDSWDLKSAESVTWNVWSHYGCYKSAESITWNVWRRYGCYKSAESATLSVWPLTFAGGNNPYNAANLYYSEFPEYPSTFYVSNSVGKLFTGAQRFYCALLSAGGGWDGFLWNLEGVTFRGGLSSPNWNTIQWNSCGSPNWKMHFTLLKVFVQLFSTKLTKLTKFSWPV